MNDIKELDSETINHYYQTLFEFSRRTISDHLATIKQLLKLLYERGYLSKNLAALVPKVKSGRDCDIPTGMSHDKIKHILSFIDRSSPLGKRNYAALLLAAELGIRNSDISNMMLENINWRECAVNFFQSKTQKPITLPLSSTLGDAIIEYLKHGRPNVKSPYVFIQHKPPYGPLKSYYAIFQKYLKLAGVNFEPGHRHGTHIFRHSLAINMLEKNIPLETISQILGHTSIHTTKNYLKVDINALRMCALNPEEVFYND